jgi:hypothetical protein
MSFSTTPDSCARHAFAITPADSDLAQPARALYIGGGGSVVATLTSGAVVTFAGINAGSILPISVKRVAAASTATSIVGLV